jgi:hypothetical protein
LLHLKSSQRPSLAGCVHIFLRLLLAELSIVVPIDYISCV